MSVTSASTDTAPARPRSPWARSALGVRRAADRGYLVWVLVGLVALQATLASEFFLTSRNLANLAGQAVPLALAATGQMAAVLVGAIDLSVGPTARLAALLTAGWINDEPALVVPVILAVIALSAAIGAANGAMVVWLRFNPLIATLISFTVLRGVALVYTQQPIGGIPVEASRILQDRFLGLPQATWMALALLAVLATALARTRFGRNVYTVGGDPEVARRVGINVEWVKFRMLVLSSVMAGLAGVVLAFRQGIGDPRVAEGLELQSIVVVVIGGVSIFGGRGSVLGVLGGVVFFNILRNAMNLQNVEPLTQGVVTAGLVIAAVALFTRRDR